MMKISNKREQFGAKLNTMKHIIWMAALALTAATWSACSNEDEPTATEQPAQARTYTVTTTLSLRNGGTRSTMTDNGDGSISATWEVNDQVYVEYETNGGGSLSKTDATVTYVDPSTKAATITVTLTDPKNGGTITFGYPYSLYGNQKSVYTDQIGTLADINAYYAGILGNGTLTVDGSNVTLPAVTMSPEMCIWKFSFTDGSSDITSAVTKLVIELPSSGQKYTVSPSSQGTIYVAMYGAINAKPIGIYAKTSTGVYRKTAASVTLDKGTTYTSTGLALTSAAIANAVAGDIGKLIGADGNIYPKADIATAFGTSGVAKVVYVGSDAETNTTYNHGLALALADASTGEKWCSKTNETCITQYNSETAAKGDMAGIANTDALVNHASHTHAAASAARNYNSGDHPTNTSAWFLPSAGQWNKIFNTIGYNALCNGFSSVGGSNMVTNSGYWSSSELGDFYAWYFKNNGVLENGGSKSSEQNLYRVRAAIAF